MSNKHFKDKKKGGLTKRELMEDWLNDRVEYFDKKTKVK